MSAYGEAAFGAGLGIVSSYISNELAREREAEARADNYKYGELAAQNADARMRALYEDYQSPMALLQQYKAAGLSPSLMFGQGAAGGGGMTQGAQGTGAAGISPTTYGAQLLEGTQIALMQAQARKTNAEADTIEGKNARGEAEIKEIVEKTNNYALQNAWYEYENARQSIKVGVESSIADKQVENYFKQTEYLTEITRSAKVKGNIDEKTEETVIKTVCEQLQNLLADTALKRANKLLAHSQSKLALKQVDDLINQIINRDAQIKINRETLTKQVEQWGKQNGLKEQEINALLIGFGIKGFNDAFGNGIDMFKFLKTNKPRALVMPM